MSMIQQTTSDELMAALAGHDRVAYLSGTVAEVLTKTSRLAGDHWCIIRDTATTLVAFAVGPTRFVWEHTTTFSGPIAARMARLALHAGMKAKLPEPVLFCSTRFGEN